MIRRLSKKKRNKLVEENLPLVYHLCRRYQHCGLEFTDLVQEGTLGLMRAIETWDPRKGKLGTHSWWWVRAFMIKAIQRNRTVHIPHHLLEKRRKAGDTNTNTVSLDDISERASTDPDPEDEMITKQRKLLAQRFLKILSERDRRIVELRFGISDGGVPHTLEEIGKKFGLTKERVRQICNRSLEAMSKREGARETL